MRVRVLDWLRTLGLQAEILQYIGTSNVRPRTLIGRPLDVAGAEVRLRREKGRPAPQRLLVSRSLGPFTGGRLEATLLGRAGWGVYDFDDALWADDRGGLHRFFGEGAGWSASVRGADLVVAGNAYLAEAAARLNPSVRIIPSCVDPSAYPVKQDYSIGAPPRLVWLGSPSTERYLQPIAPALLRVHASTGARLTLISAGRLPLGELEAMTDRVDWDGPRTDALLAEADCGVMPLPDTPFSRGKCAYKLLQYAAAGLPTIASPVGVNAQVIEQLGGLAAGDTDSWHTALVDVLRATDADRRAAGETARRAVEEHYSFAAWRGAFLDALRLPDPGAGQVPAPGPQEEAAPPSR